MKSRIITNLLVALLSACIVNSSLAQSGAQDSLGKIISDMFDLHESKTLCTEGPTSLAQIRSTVVEHLKATSTSQTFSGQAVAIAIWTRFPCPFSPYRPQLRPATIKDIEGVWLFPESSQKYRFGPRSPLKPPALNLAVRCDAVAYYPGGELRHAVIAGQAICPFRKAADMDVARANPRVASWALPNPGRISVSRTDVANHIEEWDVFVVIAPFAIYDLQFEVGELVAFVRKENGNDVNAATQFRHLQKLP